MDTSPYIPNLHSLLQNLTQLKDTTFPRAADGPGIDEAVDRLASAAEMCIEACANAGPPVKPKALTKVLSAVFLDAKGDQKKFQEVCKIFDIKPYD
jgi:hypothetical protein